MTWWMVPPEACDITMLSNLPSVGGAQAAMSNYSDYQQSWVVWRSTAAMLAQRAQEKRPRGYHRR